MFISSEQKLTFSRFFLEPANATHRQYEALRAYFVEGASSKEAAQRFHLIQVAARAIDSGDARRTLARFVERSQALASAGMA